MDASSVDSEAFVCVDHRRIERRHPCAALVTTILRLAFAMLVYRTTEVSTTAYAIREIVGAAFALLCGGAQRVELSVSSIEEISF